MNIKFKIQSCNAFFF